MGNSIPLGFPDRIMSKLRYHDAETLTSTAGSLGKYVYRWNSTFDPDASGVGHQPMFRDTFAGIYDHYAVVRASATVKFINSSSVAMFVGMVTDDDTTTSSTLDTLCEQTHGWHELLPAQAGSLSTVTHTFQWECVKYLGIDPYTSEQYKTAVGSNPTEESTITVWVLSTDGSTQSMLVDSEIVYTILWTELASPSQS
jgi:hypothetical protein